MSPLSLRLADEVRDALDRGAPVVALESTIISHGMPYPQNVETARAVETIVRDAGAVPATIAVLGGTPTVGLDDDALERLGRGGADVMKVSVRELPYVVATGADGATTVSATMRLAALAGVRVFATGGTGGVHRGAEQTFDISADLTELARTDVAVVSAGVKSILDVGRTLEVLETLGIPVVVLGAAEFPAFYSRESGFPAPLVVDTPADVARVLHAKRALGLSCGALVANPIPRDAEIPRAEIDPIIEQALAEMDAARVVGKSTTPFLLKRIVEITGGRSLAANVALVKHNARAAAEIAAALSRVA